MGRKKVYLDEAQKKAAAKRSRDRFKERHPDRVAESIQKETQRISALRESGKQARAKARLEKDTHIYKIYVDELVVNEWGALVRTADRLGVTTFVVRGAIRRVEQVPELSKEKEDQS